MGWCWPPPPLTPSAPQGRERARENILKASGTAGCPRRLLFETSSMFREQSSLSPLGREKLGVECLSSLTPRSTGHVLPEDLSILIINLWNLQLLKMIISCFSLVHLEKLSFTFLPCFCPSWL